MELSGNPVPYIRIRPIMRCFGGGSGVSVESGSASSEEIPSILSHSQEDQLVENYTDRQAGRQVGK